MHMSSVHGKKERTQISHCAEIITEYNHNLILMIILYSTFS